MTKQQPIISIKTNSTSSEDIKTVMTKKWDAWMTEQYLVIDAITDHIELLKQSLIKQEIKQAQRLIELESMMRNEIEWALNQSTSTLRFHLILASLAVIGIVSVIHWVF